MKKLRKEDIKVVIIPEVYGCADTLQGDEFIIMDCNSIVEQIRRHVDDVKYVSVEFTPKYYCEFCDREWEVWTKKDELENPKDEWCKEGMPTCCPKAQDEYVANLTKPK